MREELPTCSSPESLPFLRRGSAARRGKARTVVWGDRLHHLTAASARRGGQGTACWSCIGVNGLPKAILTDSIGPSGGGEAVDELQRELTQ